MQKEKLIHSLYQIGAIQFGEFTLKSGQTSSVYLNLRKIISYPAVLRNIASAMWSLTNAQHIDLVCGVPYTALPIATSLSILHNIPMVMRRKEKKEYGTKQLIEGVYMPNQRCLVIEDVITTGGSILETTQDLEQAGIKVTDVIALIDREQGGSARLAKQYRLHTLLSLAGILNYLLAASFITNEERSSIEQFLLTTPA